MFGSVEKSSCLLVLVSSCCAYFDAANWHTYIQRYCQNIYYTYINIYMHYMCLDSIGEACGQRQRVMPHAEHKKLFTVFDNNFSMGHSLSPSLFLSHCIYSSLSLSLFDSPPLSHSPFLWYLFIIHSGTGNLPRLIEKCFKNLLGLGLFKGVV